MSKLKYIVMIAIMVLGISLILANTVPNSTSFASGYVYVDEQIGPQLSTQELVATVAPAVVSIVTESVS